MRSAIVREPMFSMPSSEGSGTERIAPDLNCNQPKFRALFPDWPYARFAVQSAGNLSQ
jgi:hypothetical protein